MYKRLFILFTILLLQACSSTKTLSPEESNKLRVANINVQLGIAYLERGDMSRSKQKLLMALEQAPNIPEPWYAMAYFLEKTGNKEESERYYLKAIQLAPRRGDVQNNYGTFLCRNGRYNESVQHFLIAINDKTYLNPADAYENAGICAMKIPDYKRAEAYLQKALLADPTRSNITLSLAQLNYTQGRYNLASKKIKEFNLMTNPTQQSLALAEAIEKKLTPKIIATKAVVENPKLLAIKETAKSINANKKKSVRVS